MARKFTFEFVLNKEELKRAVGQAKVDRPVWILVARAESLLEYGKVLDKQEVWKRGMVRFIYEGSDHLPQQLRSRVVFMNPQKKEVEKFLLNIFRRDKQVFFWSSIPNGGNIILAIMRNQHGQIIHIS